MFDQGEIETLIAAMRQYGVHELHVATEGAELLLALPAMPVTATVSPPAPQRFPVKSTAMGCLQAPGADDGLVAVAEGDTVGEGQILGYVKDGPALSPLVAPSSGVLRVAQGAAGRVIGFGDVVFEIEAQP